MGVGEPGKGWVIQPSLGLSFLPRLVYVDGSGEGAGRRAGCAELSTCTHGEGPQRIWTDPSALLVPVGRNTKGFGLCCFATAAVCSLSCLLLFMAPSFLVFGYIDEIPASCPFLPVQVLLYSKGTVTRDSVTCCWWTGESKGIRLQY